MFLGGVTPLLHITTKNAGAPSLLIVRDSYADSLVPFLTDDFSSIDLIDLRYYKGSVADYVKEHDIDSMQQSAKPAYAPDEGLSRGTLFPGLDLPFMNMVNTGGLMDTPHCELMALTFAADELELYLDTHPADSEAFAVYQDILKLRAEAVKRYTKLYGPVTQSDMLGMASARPSCAPASPISEDAFVSPPHSASQAASTASVIFSALCRRSRLAVFSASSPGLISARVSSSIS